MTAMAIAAVTASAALAAPRPFGLLRCHTRSGGVRFCPGNGTTQRVRSWDGVPLDVDVTLPPARFGPGPYPTIVLLHGWGGNKAELEWPGSQSTFATYSNIYYARHGFATVNYTGRGEGRSCGTQVAPPATLSRSQDCARGFVRIADQRFDARDAQWLVGLLTDERIADPARIGVTGWSYGAGRTYELAFLRDRVRCAGRYDRFRADPCAGKPIGAFVPWRSPRGTPLRIAAAWPRFGFSDLAYALIPNGHFLDYDPATEWLDGSARGRGPVGIPLLSVDTFLYNDGLLEDGYYEPAGGAAAWDLTGQFHSVSDGGIAALRRVAREWSGYHSGFGIPGRPAPMLIESGFTDEFFPPEEALRVYDYARARGGFVQLQIGDLGHPRAAFKPNLARADDLQALAFFSALLKHKRRPGRSGSVTAFTMTCPSTGPHAPPEGGPFRARSWAALHPGIVVLKSRIRQIVRAESGDRGLSSTFDPGSGPMLTDPNACLTVPAQSSLGTAVYSWRSRGFTLMGLPTIVASVAVGRTSGDPGQLDARLWDVLPDGRQRLITRTGYRLSGRGPQRIVFQLHGNGYRFDSGHRIKLELFGDDAPYYRWTAGGPDLTVRSLEIVLPTLQKPNGRRILAPAAAPLPVPGEAGPRTTQGARIG